MIWMQHGANLLTHTIYCLTRFLQGPQLRRHLSFLSVFTAKERRPHPADSTLQVHGEIILILHCCTQKSVNLCLPGQCQCIENTCSYFSNAQWFFSSTLLRMRIWPACWVQVLLGTWKTWAWPSPTSPVPVLSSSSSCLHSNSSTSGPHRWTHSKNNY